jgi:hypothetical protein
MCACTAGSDLIDVAQYGDINNQILSKFKLRPSAFRPLAFRLFAVAQTRSSTLPFSALKTFEFSFFLP